MQYLHFVILLNVTLIFTSGQVIAKGGSADIYDAARSGDTLTLDSILQLNPDLVNTPNTNSHTLLILSCYNNKPNTAKYLIRKGANVNYTFYQGSALHGAAFKGYIDIVRLLVAKGIEVNVADRNGSTPLIYATLFGHTEIAELLYENGANPDHKDNTGSSASEYAVMLENTELIKLFTSTNVKPVE